VSRNMAVFFVFYTWRVRWAICGSGCIIVFVQPGGQYTNCIEIIAWCMERMDG